MILMPCSAEEWPELESYIDRASGAVESISWIQEQVQSGKLMLCKLMIGSKIYGAVILEQWRGASVCMSLCADDLPKGWQIDFLKWWTAIANMQRANRLLIRGRKGWIRVLRPLGFNPNGKFLELKL